MVYRIKENKRKPQILFVNIGLKDCKSYAFLRLQFLFAATFCPSGYSISNVTGTCYKWRTRGQPWDAARAQCQTEGGDLVSLPTREKFNEFQSMARATGN